jgi:hypothetical protein
MQRQSQQPRCGCETVQQSDRCVAERSLVLQPRALRCCAVRGIVRCLFCAPPALPCPALPCPALPCPALCAHPMVISSPLTATLVVLLSARFLTAGFLRPSALCGFAWLRSATGRGGFGAALRCERAGGRARRGCAARTRLVRAHDSKDILAASVERQQRRRRAELHRLRQAYVRVCVYVAMNEYMRTNMHSFLQPSIDRCTEESATSKVLLHRAAIYI